MSPEQTRGIRPLQSSTIEEGQRVLYNKSWAVVVGINHYAHDLPRLGNAQNDAQAIAEILSDQYHFDEVHTLYNEQATQRAIMSWLRDKLPEGTQKNDRVIFFFAGHGVTQATIQGGKRGYLAPYDAEKGEYANYIEMWELLQACSTIAAKHILIILDCCFSGVAAVSARAAPRPTPKEITDPYLRRITEKDTWQILTAGDSDDMVADSSLHSSHHSVFTSVLLDALKGAADHNNDHLFTATDLAAYVKPLVTRESAINTGRSQTPFFNYLAGSGQGDFVFVLPPQEQMIPAAPSSPIPSLDGTWAPAPAATRSRLWAVIIVVLLLGMLTAGAIYRFWPGTAVVADISALQGGAIWTNPKDGADYVWIPRGEFPMGSTPAEVSAAIASCRSTAAHVEDCERSKFSREQPLHTVYVDAFWIQRTEVTNGQYAACVSAIACDPPHNERWRDNHYADYPVTDVTWQQSQEYATWIGGRLPTEAEWEKAACGDDGRLYPWGNEPPSQSRLNFIDSEIRDTQPVGTYPAGASPYGILDMAGNVMEWTADWYADDYYANSAHENPTGPERGNERTMRGGAFDLYANDVRCARRVRFKVDYSHANVGFRVVLERSAKK
jgi:formylglycine-generating enzyme required for sulfatase activity